MRTRTGLLFAVALLTAFSGSAQAGAEPEVTLSASEIQDITRKLDQMRAEMSRLESLRAELEALQARVAETEETSAYLEEEVEDLDDRLMKPERKSGMDRIEWSGDFRFEAHSIEADVPDHFNGLGLQRQLVDTLFYFGATGMPPMGPNDVPNLIQQNYADYLFFQDNLTFEQIQQALGQFPPELQQQLIGSLVPSIFVPGYAADNDVIYTNRLRLRMHAEVSDNVTFDGRLGMYKVWGDSTGVQIFNGQPTSVSWDGTTVGVPNSDVIRLERGYFTWSNVADLPMYLSIGRRPSTDGVPLNFRNDEPRGGTPLGSLINYQFDGLTLGYHINDMSTIRFCYGIGFESDWGTGSILQSPSDRLDDAAFYGLNWDVWNTDEMFVQATVATAKNVSDGFNGLTVLPINPLNGQDIGAPLVMRYTPSTDMGDIDLASFVIVRHDGPFDWFFSYNYMETNPNPVTTPFGGLLSDPFQAPEKQDGDMYYLGVRYNFNDNRTKLGFEFNHGSQYWFNFALAEDDLLGPKTSTRGDVIELYLTHRINDRFIIKADYIDYDFDYSGSGWLLGAPQDLDATPIIGFPTYKSASKFMLSFQARF